LGPAVAKTHPSDRSSVLAMTAPPLCPDCGQPASEALAGPAHGFECRNEACPEFGQPVTTPDPGPDADAGGRSG
jgi:hypothetical protein